MEGCDYCRKIQGNKMIFEDHDFCTEDGKAYVEKAEILRFINQETYTILVNGRIDIDINFCPFCGRRLKGKIGEKE